MQGKLRGRGQREALNLLRAEAKNLAAVCQMLVERRDHSHLIQFLPDYLLYNEYHNRHAEYTELSGLLSSMLQWLAPPSGAEEADWLHVAHPELLALVLAALRHFGMTFRNQETIIDFTQKSLMIAQNLPDSPLKAIIFLLNATGAAGIGAQEVMRICLQSIAIFQNQRDSWGVATASLITGDLELFDMHDKTSCTLHYQDALSLYREMGNDWGQGKCLFGLATQCQQAGQYEQAYELMSQSAQFFEALNTQASYIMAMMSLADLAEKLGRTTVALQHFQQLLHYFKQNGDEHNQTACQERIESLKGILQKTGDGCDPS
jgi:tetratricopeptide (TPR) repeat protein